MINQDLSRFEIASWSPSVNGCFLLASFESWFDIDSLSEAENVVAVEREQSILSMLHQVSRGAQRGGQCGTRLV